MENEIINESKLKKIYLSPYFSLGIIILIGLVLRIYFAPWNLPSDSPDAFVYMNEAYYYSRGEFSYVSRVLWPFFLSLFLTFFEFDNSEGYLTITRIVSICVSVATAPILFIIAKRFVKEKYAIIAAALFIIEANIIENSIFGITEPLFILLGLLSFYFAIHPNKKYLLIAFIFAGLSLDVRLNGIVLFILIICVFIIKHKSFKNDKKIILIGIGIFLLVISPIMFSNVNGGELPFYQVGDIINQVASGEVATYDSLEESNSFNIISSALKNELLHIFRISIPYLIIFFPFGLIVSLKNLNFQKKILFLTIIISLLVAIPQYTMSNEYRNLFFITPFLSILGAIGLQKLTDNIEFRKYFLICLIGGLVLLSGYFLQDRYDIDKEIVLEKYEVGGKIATNFEGKIMGHLRLQIMQHMPGIITVGYAERNSQISLWNPVVTIDTIPKLMEYVTENKIDYIVMDDIYDKKHFPIFKQILHNQENFPYLEKVYDAHQDGYTKINVQVFKINYLLYDDKK